MKPFEGRWAVAYGVVLISVGIGFGVWRYALGGSGWWLGQWGLHLVFVLGGAGSIWAGRDEMARGVDGGSGPKG